MTSTWSATDLQTIDDEDEVALASRRRDGSLSSPATIWIVRVGDEVFVRSAFGPGNRWYARALSSAAGHIAIGGVDRDVSFEHGAGAAENTDIDEAFHAKYDAAYPKEYVDPVVDATAQGCTLRLIPA